LLTACWQRHNGASARAAADLSGAAATEALTWLTRQRIPHRQVSSHWIEIGQEIILYLVKGTLSSTPCSGATTRSACALEQLLKARRCRL
jgi:hypothetical protein